jgi:hypothetical protein
MREGQDFSRPSITREITRPQDPGSFFRRGRQRETLICRPSTGRCALFQGDFETQIMLTVVSADRSMIRHPGDGCLGGRGRFDIPFRTRIAVRRLWRPIDRQPTGVIDDMEIVVSGSLTPS